jgi:hypothetical protein
MIDIKYEHKRYTLEMELPEKLYKYRTFSTKHIDALKRNELWFSIGESFNDPFDCTPETPMILGDRESFITLANKVYPDQIEQLKLMYGSLNKAYEHFHYSMVGGGQRSYEPLINAMLDRLVRSYVFCLSTTARNHLLWSHYADYHKGFCIRYNTERLLSHASIDFHGHVNYSDSPINMSEFAVTENKVKASREFVMQKQTDWYYEQEFRLVHKELAANIDDKTRVIKHSDDCIDMIIFGVRASRSDKEKVKDTMSGRNIIYKEIERGQINYELFVH